MTTPIRVPSSSDIVLAEPYAVVAPEHEHGDVADLRPRLHYQASIADNTPTRFFVEWRTVTLLARSMSVARSTAFASLRSRKAESMIPRSQAVSLVSSTLLAGFLGGASLFAWTGIGAHPLFWLTGALGAAGVATAEVLLLTKKTKKSVWSRP